MTIWVRIGELAGKLTQGAGTLVDRLVETLSALGSAEARERIAFSVAMIALSAKMAKADGVVTRSEVEAFRQVFAVPAGDERNVQRLFDLAQQDVAGFDVYARRIRDLHVDKPDMLEDIVEGLFHIAKADGIVHERELGFLAEVARLFGLSDDCFERITARHIRLPTEDPYRVLGIGRDASDAEIKRHYRVLVVENHPDRHMARGMPEEFVRIATERLAAINAAYERIAGERGL